MATRAQVGRGRIGKSINLFAGILRDGFDGEHMYYRNTTDDGRKPVVHTARTHRAPLGESPGYMCYPAGELEVGLLDKLKQLDPAKIFADESAERDVDKLQAVEGRLTPGDKADCQNWKRSFTRGVTATSRPVVATLRKLCEQRDAATAERTELRQAAVSPPQAALEDTQRMADTIRGKAMSEEDRIKLLPSRDPATLIDRINLWIFKGSPVRGTKALVRRRHFPPGSDRRYYVTLSPNLPVKRGRAESRRRSRVEESRCRLLH